MQTCLSMLAYAMCWSTLGNTDWNLEDNGVVHFNNSRHFQGYRRVWNLDLTMTFLDPSVVDNLINRGHPIPFNVKQVTPHVALIIAEPCYVSGQPLTN